MTGSRPPWATSRVSTLSATRDSCSTWRGNARCIDAATRLDIATERRCRSSGSLFQPLAITRIPRGCVELTIDEGLATRAGRAPRARDRCSHRGARRTARLPNRIDGRSARRVVRARGRRADRLSAAGTADVGRETVDARRPRCAQRSTPGSASDRCRPRHTRAAGAGGQSGLASGADGCTTGVGHRRRRTRERR